jgi:hypothetical protein
VALQQPVLLNRTAFQCSTSLCPCKSWQYAASAQSQCVALQNLTVGVDGLCHNASCPAGFRLYHTGSSLACFQPFACHLDGYTNASNCIEADLFESACQGTTAIF